MEDKDFKEMMEFIGRRFEGIDEQFKAVHARFDNTASKDDLVAAKEETMRYTGILIENVQRNIEIIAEGIQGINEKTAIDKDDHDAELRRLEKRILINTSDISGLDKRVVRLEGA